MNQFTHLWMKFHHENRFFRTWFNRCSNQSSRWFYGMSINSIGLFSSHESSQWLFLVSVLDIIIWPIFVVFIHTSTIYFINNYKIRSHKIKSDNPVCQHSLLFIIIITIMIFSSVQADWIAAEFVKPVQTRFGKKCSVLINLWTRRQTIDCVQIINI